jgi:hypothetical protein
MPSKEIEMSAITVLVPHSDHSAAHRSAAQLRPVQPSAPACTIISAAPATAHRRKGSRDRASSASRLTDRGIAAVMVVTAMILTAAIVVIGLTAVRVTSADDGGDMRESRHSQH